MEQGFISLLYPTEAAQSRAAEKGGVPNISEAVCEELGLSSLIDLRNSSLSKYFTDDPAVIRYRQAAVSDMLQSKEIGETLNRVLPILFDITELRRLDTERVSTGDSYLYSITEIELYISCIEALRDGFSPIRDKVESEAFLHLFRVIFELAESDYYKDLNEKLSSLASRIREVKSITVGVNLDEMLRPSGAGVISINSEPFKSGKVLDKILRMSFRNDAMTCIASLVPFGKKQSENQKTALSLAFNSAINEVYKQSLRSWKKIVQSYVLENTDFLINLMPEIEFIVKGTEFMRQLKERGCTLCIPDISDANEILARDSQGLYGRKGSHQYTF